MKLSMSMFESRLSHHHNESSIRDDVRTIGGMRFLSEQRSEFSRDYVYIGRAGVYLDELRDDDALILANGMDYIVCRGPSLDELLNDVLGVFDFFNDFEQRLLSAQTKSSPVAEMMEIVGGALEDPCLAFAIDGTFLAGCNMNRLADAQVRESVEGSGSLGAATIGGRFVDEDGVISHDLSDVPRVSRDGKGGEAVCMYILQDGERVGFLMCFPSSPNGTRLAMALEPLAADAISHADEFTEAFSPQQSLRLALRALIDGGTVTHETRERIGAALGGTDALALVAVRSLAVQNRTQRMLLASEIERSGVSCVATEVDETVAFLVSRARVDDLVHEASLRIDPAVAVVGVSMSISGLDSAQSAFRQAVFACEAESGPGVRRCRDLALPFLMGVLKGEPMALDFLHPALDALDSYDHTNATELLPTLRAYIECGGNQSRAAERLYVHLNTMKYRLGRICDITGIDLKDADAMFHIALSLRLRA